MGELLRDYPTPVDLRFSDVVGTWHAGADRVFTFSVDGRFTATNVPPGAFQHPVLPHTVDGSGLWGITKPRDHPDGPAAELTLAFERFDGAEERFDASMTALRHDDEEVHLVVYHADVNGNDSWTAYEKDGLTRQPPPRSDP